MKDIDLNNWKEKLKTSAFLCDIDGNCHESELPLLDEGWDKLLNIIESLLSQQKEELEKDRISVLKVFEAYLKSETSKDELIKAIDTFKRPIS